ncbi:MAG: hypothetical protein ACRDQ2_16500 [Gaiellales bacterium]
MILRSVQLGVAIAVVAAVVATSASGGSGRALVPSSLKPFASLTLSGSKGAIRAVVYDGNHALVFRDQVVTTAMTGFTVPAAPFTAKTTFVVADGQCSSSAPNGCRGVLTPVGLGDTLSFAGGASMRSLGPDAIKGSDGCPWGQDTCLWDTLSFDVSHYLAPGAKTVSVTLNRGVDGTGNDCFNHEAQVFAVGPSSAWTDAGYVAAGIGLRNQGSGNVTVSGIPAGAVVQKALLYWNVLNESEPPRAISVNQTPFAGTMIGRDEGPCWGTPWSWAYRADVTSRVKSSGAYTISGYPTGTTSGGEPFTNPRLYPMMEGASLIVFYAPKAPPNTVSGSPTGTVRVNGKPYTGGPIPYGAKVDVTKGKVTLKADVGTLTASGGGGISAQFILLRAKAAGKPIVELRLTGGDFKACATRAAQSRVKTAKTVRRLWAKGSGRFRTRGRYASAAIRGTDWLTADRCGSTFVKTRQGVVSVLDLLLKKTVLVKAGQGYVAKKKPSAAARTLAGDFAGPMDFRTAGGSIWQTQYARVSVKNATASVRWTYGSVPWNAPAVCTHNLVRISGGPDLAFRVNSTTGSCIPNAKSYRIALKGGRAAVHLVYGTGPTASGSLPRR